MKRLLDCAASLRGQLATAVSRAVESECERITRRGPALCVKIEDGPLANMRVELPHDCTGFRFSTTRQTGCYKRIGDGFEWGGYDV